MKTKTEPEQLFQAAARNDAAGVKEMIAAGADPNSVSEKFGHTPLYNACISGAADSASALIAAGANPNLRFTYRSPVDGRVEADIVALTHARAEIRLKMTNCWSELRPKSPKDA